MTCLRGFDRITIDPNRCLGRPCVRDLRMPVHSVLSYLAAGMTEAQVLREWPELEPEDIHQALAFAAWATSERVLELESQPV